MKKTLFFAFLLLLLAGCSQRKNFQPKEIQGAAIFPQTLKSPVIQTSRTSATLKNGTILSQMGQTLLKNKTNTPLINETPKFYILSNNCQNIELINKSTQESKTYPISTCLVAASIKDNLLAYVLRDNSYGILDLSTGEFKLTDRASQIMAVNSLIASPLFLDTTVVFPTLDGQLIVASTQSFSIERVLIVDSEPFFGNIIYLDKLNTSLVAATSKKLIVLNNGRQFQFSAEIRDLKVKGDFIYLLTLEGKILQLNSTLAIINQIEIPYAVLSGIVIEGSKLFTMERQGYLIELNLEDFTYKVFKARSRKKKLSKHKTLFYDNEKFYYDRFYLDFSKDWK